MMLKVICTVP